MRRFLFLALAATALAFFSFGCSSGYTSAERSRATESQDLPGATSLSPSSGVYSKPVVSFLFDRRDPGQTDAASSEELWVIGKANTKATERPPGGRLDFEPGLVTRNERQELVPLPLWSTEVRARVLGFIASVDVAQRFRNPYDGLIEAEYVFPLPEDAGVTGFVMTVGERRIRGVVREREEAERIYTQARAQGRQASLLTEERPNVFTQRVANIEPGHAIDVNISFFHACAWEDGWMSWTFPTVVGPRYNPAGFQGGIGAAPREAPGSSGQPVEVAYLQPGQQADAGFRLRLELDAGVDVAEIASPTHSISVEWRIGPRAEIVLPASRGAPDRDIVVRWRLAGGGVRAALLAERAEREGGHFALMLFPPDLQAARRQPLDLVFVLDTSGSMEGAPIEALRAAMFAALDELTPADSFQIVRFSDDVTVSRDGAANATTARVDEARRQVRALTANGGTEMLRGLDAALALPRDPERPRHLVFLTDGFIGNDGEVLERVARRLGGARIGCLGIGSAPNRYLLEGMARLGHGFADYALAPDAASDAMSGWMRSARAPAVTEVRLDWGGLAVEDVLPARIPDIYPEHPVLVVGRFRTGHATTARLSGRYEGQPIAVPIPVTLDAARPQGDLARFWARARIGDLADDALRGDGSAPRLVKELALDYGLSSPFTAFVAVDSRSTATSSVGTTVPVAVPVPAGTRYATTIGGK